MRTLGPSPANFSHSFSLPLIPSVIHSPKHSYNTNITFLFFFDLPIIHAVLSGAQTMAHACLNQGELIHVRV